MIHQKINYYNIITFCFISCCCCWLCCFNCTAACDFNCSTVALVIQDRLDLAAVESAPSVSLLKISVNCCTLKFKALPFSAYEIETKKAIRK